MVIFGVGELTDVMSLQLVLPAVLALIGLGFVVVYAMRDQVDANWAKVFFVAAAAYWVAKVIMWGAKTSHGFGFRFLVAFALTGLAGAFVIEAWRLVGQKHDQQQPSINHLQNPSSPPQSVSTPTPSAATTPKKERVNASIEPTAKQRTTKSSINQTMTNSAGGIQAGRDVTIGRKPSPTTTEKDKKP